MLANTLVILASDGTKMNALLYTNKKKSNQIIIHVHGMAGNFYENSFIEVIAERAKMANIDYLSFNNRGHDYISDCERIIEGQTESFAGGCAYETFRECINDLEGVIKWAVENGYEEIILEGHSSGANKIVYSIDKLNLKKDIKEKLKGIVLISPCDDLGIYFSETDEKAAKKSLEMATQFINNNNEDALMPPGTFFDYLLSAKTFKECFVEKSPLDMFPYRNGTLEGTEISKIELPIHITFGNNGDFVLQDFDMIEEMYRSIDINYEISIIEDAGHSYKNCEYALAENIITWVKGIVNNVE